MCSTCTACEWSAQWPWHLQQLHPAHVQEVVPFIRDHMGHPLIMLAKNPTVRQSARLLVGDVIPRVPESAMCAELVVLLLSVEIARACLGSLFWCGAGGLVWQYCTVQQ